MAEVLPELVIKTLGGSQHIGNAPFYVFLGVDVEEIVGNPWSIWTAVFCTLPYATSLLVYKWLKARCQHIFFLLIKLMIRKSGNVGILSANTTSRVESSSNGMTFFGSVISWLAGLAIICMIFLGRKVNQPVESPSPPHQWHSGDTEEASAELTAVFYLATAVWPVICSSWVVWNREAQRFVLRRLRCYRRPAAVAPALTAGSTN